MSGEDKREKYKTVIIVLDNFMLHWAKTRELGVVLVYSPELNPIEQIWGNKESYRPSSLKTWESFKEVLVKEVMSDTITDREGLRA